MTKLRPTLIPSAILALAVVALLAACSTTSAIPEGEQLYWGQKPVQYADYTPSEHFDETRLELDAALAAAPTGAFLGSSTVRNPLPVGLWMWNAFSRSKSKLGKWANRKFGTEPLLMSDFNPQIRATVATEALMASGYFHGKVTYEELPMKNPKKGRIAYTVHPGPVSLLDTLVYANFPPVMDSLIHATRHEAFIGAGAPFSATALEAERNRLATLFRNNGYYFYSPSFAIFKADTLAHPGRVSMRLQLADSLDSRVLQQWTIGKTDITIKRQFGEQIDHTAQRRTLSLHYNGRRIPVRSRVILSEMKLRPRQLFTESAYRESLANLTAHDMFSMIDFAFTPRDTANILDMSLNCILDKPYDVTVEANVTGKTSSRFGPGAEVSLTRRNAFRAGEKLSLNFVGSYEWQTGGSGQKNNVSINSYEYGANVTLELPRLLMPMRKRHRWAATPSTLVKVSNNVVNRGSFFNRHIMAAELTYSLQTTATRKHILSPLIMEYDRLNRASDEFREVLAANPYLYISMQDQLIPKMRYTFIYTSPKNYRSPITWESTFSESGNLFSVGYAIGGRHWTERGKPLLRNPYAQFVKIDSDITKKWHLSDHSDLVGHINAGVIWSYGNSQAAPYSEQFFVGGANSIRAFTVRSIGPGRYHAPTQSLSYLDQTGDVKFVANLEYRPRLFGSLYGAVFLDAGNVWALHNDGIRGQESVFRFKHFLRDMAVATGLGLRYDLDFFVIRFDWGLGLHLPYDTGRSGFFNLPSLRNSHSFHIAIGYPF